MRRPWPTRGCCPMVKNTYSCMENVQHSVYQSDQIKRTYGWGMLFVWVRGEADTGILWVKLREIDDLEDLD